MARLVDVGKGCGKPGGFLLRRPRSTWCGWREGGPWGKQGFPHESAAELRCGDQAMKVIAGTARSMGVEVE